MSYHHKTLKGILSEGDVTLNVGGDTYCYGAPYMSYTLNRITEERKIKNIFWGCSVDERLTDDLEKQKDVNRYFKIITRESYTKKLIDSVVNNKEKVLLACDPAFQLDAKKTELPCGFSEGNTVGINISHLMYNEKDRFDESAIYANIIKLIDYIIQKTDMNVCLVPHVYNIKNNTGDICVLKELKAVYSDNPRVSIVDKELNCCELKYIISKLRFFIGARTHSVIAAYSTNVPTIALSYSIKSRGIAYDLFGKEEGYVISWKNLTSADILLTMFTDLMKNEKEIKEHYEAVMPKYKESIVKTAKCVMEEAFCGK